MSPRRDWLVIPGDEDDPPRLMGTFVAQMPAQFGSVIRFEARRGRVVAISETGDAMILPIGKGV